MSVDPRVGLELEKLNNSCEKINNLEVNLGKLWKYFVVYCLPQHPTHIYSLFADELKRNYQDAQETSQAEIKIISGKIKNAIDLAKPFYEARRQTSELLKDLKVDQSNHERAKTNLAAAKEMVFLAEQSVTQVGRLDLFNWKDFNETFLSFVFFKNAQAGCGLDIALQEMISHATSRVNQYTDECNRWAWNKLLFNSQTTNFFIFQDAKSITDHWVETWDGEHSCK